MKNMLRVMAGGLLTSCLWIHGATAGGIIAIPELKTEKMGGVDHPSKAELLAMHQSPYILHARGGKLTKIPVEKTHLPGDPAEWAHQAIRLATGQDGAVYVKLFSLVCKSTDGGRTWDAHPHDRSVDGSVQILGDGTFISLGIPGVEGEPYWRKPAEVWSSSDEGRNWKMVTRIERPTQYNGIAYEWWYATYPLYRLPDDTLLWPVQLRNTKNTSPPYKKVLVIYRSSNGGKTWQGPVAFADWSSEGGMVRTASGKLLAAVRYQRRLLPDDPPDLCDGRTWGGCNYYPWLKSVPYKHTFLVESHDDGKTWNNFRQLTTTLGQCYGFPAALNNGTIVVVHTTPYGPGERGSRAIVSHDDGKTWQDEVYYLTYSEESGYNQSVTLGGDTILTVAARNDTQPFTAIRWRPVPPIDDVSSAAQKKP